MEMQPTGGDAEMVAEPAGAAEALLALLDERAHLRAAYADACDRVLALVPARPPSGVAEPAAH